MLVYVSSVCFPFNESSPLLITRVNVPFVLFTFETSYLILCFEPLTRILFVVAVVLALFSIVPSPCVYYLNE